MVNTTQAIKRNLVGNAHFQKILFLMLWLKGCSYYKNAKKFRKPTTILTCFFEKELKLNHLRLMFKYLCSMYRVNSSYSIFCSG